MSSPRPARRQRARSADMLRSVTISGGSATGEGADVVPRVRAIGFLKNNVQIFPLHAPALVITNSTGARNPGYVSELGSRTHVLESDVHANILMLVLPQDHPAPSQSNLVRGLPFKRRLRRSSPPSSSAGENRCPAGFEAWPLNRPAQSRCREPSFMGLRVRLFVSAQTSDRPR